jgi:predicted carbohydrate-binding protein with CBM5 and CBM33 domain
MRDQPKAELSFSSTSIRIKRCYEYGLLVEHSSQILHPFWSVPLERQTDLNVTQSRWKVAKAGNEFYDLTDFNINAQY